MVVLDFGKEEPAHVDAKEQQPLANNSTGNNSAVANNERPTKRARRTRHDTFSGLDTNTHATTESSSAPVEHVLRSQVPASTATTTTNQKKNTTGINNIIIYCNII